MPPKRKIEEEAASSSAKIPRTRESGSSETISYDDYIRGSIPDTLLEGLGFDGDDHREMLANEEDALNSAECMEDVIEIPSTNEIVSAANEMTTMMANQLSALTAATPGSQTKGIPPERYLKLIASKAADDVVETSQAKSSPIQNLSADGMPRSRPFPLQNVTLKNRPTPGLTASPHYPAKAASLFVISPGGRHASSFAARPLATRGGRGGYMGPTRTIRKGSVVYKKLPTGEVIASLAEPSSSTKPPRLDADKPTIAGQHANVGLSRLPARPPIGPGCPFDEHNVDIGLKLTLQATRNMHTVLASLRDDLKRISPSESYIGGVEQIKKRHTVLMRLAKALTDYKSIVGVVRQRPRDHDSNPPANRLVAALVRKSTQPASNPTETKDAKESDVKMRPGIIGSVSRGRAKSKSSPGQRDVIELSDSEPEKDDEDEIIAEMAARDRDSEKKSRDQRALEREAQRIARLASSQHKQKTKNKQKTTEKVDLCEEDSSVVVSVELDNEEKEDSSVTSVLLDSEQKEDVGAASVDGNNCE